MTEDEQHKQEDAMVAAAAARLSEHFDGVQVLVCRPMPGGGTVSFYHGYGTIFSRLGMAKDFVDKVTFDGQANQIAEALADRLNSEDGGD